MLNHSNRPQKTNWSTGYSEKPVSGSARQESGDGPALLPNNTQLNKHHNTAKGELSTFILLTFSIIDWLWNVSLT